eukprot:521264_1
MNGYRVIGGSLNTCPPLFSSDGRYVWVSNSRVIFCIAVGSSNGGCNNVTGGGCDENPKTKKKSHIHGGRGGLSSDDTVENSFAGTTATSYPRPLQELHGHEADVSCLVWLDEKRDLLASSSLDGTVRVWVVVCEDEIHNNASQRPRCTRILRFESSVFFLHSLSHPPVEVGAKSGEGCTILVMKATSSRATKRRKCRESLEERKETAANKGNHKHESEGLERLCDRRKLEAPQEEVGNKIKRTKVELRKRAIGDKEGNPPPSRGSSDTVNDDGIGGVETCESSQCEPTHRTCSLSDIQENKCGHNNHKWEVLSVCLGKAVETEGGGEEEKNMELQKWSSVPLFRSVRTSKGSVPLCATFLHGTNEFLAVSRGCGLMVVSLATSQGAYQQSPPHLWEPDLLSLGIPSGGKGRVVTAIAGSVTGAIATGHYDGTITIWHGMGAAAEQALLLSRSSGRPTTPPSSLVTVVTTHWHAHAVSCLYFSPDGKFLLSGGEEGVLVQWNLVIGSKSFLPRLGGALFHVRQSKDGVHAAVAVKDNSLKLIRIASWSICWELRGLALAPPSDVEDFTGAIRLITNGISVEGSVDSSNLVAVNGLPGHIQFYDVALDALVENLEVTTYNRVSRTEELKSRPPVVRLVCFSPTGDRMVTVDSRFRGTTATVWELKFWNRGRDKGKFTVDTLLRSPHDGPLVEALYHPYSDFVVTLSKDGVYKTWELKQEKYQKEEASLAPRGQWVASRSVRFKVGLKAFGAALSGDGSVLAVSHGRVVALWESTAARLLGTLTVATMEPVHNLCFPSFRTALIGTGEGSLISWDLRSLRPSWYYESADVRCLAPVSFGASQGTGLFVISISLWEENEVDSVLKAKEQSLGVGLAPIGPGIRKIEAVVPPLHLKLPKKKQHEGSSQIGLKADLIQFDLPPTSSFIAAESTFNANTLNLSDPSLLLEPYLIGQLGRGIGVSSSSALSSASATQVVKPNEEFKDSTTTMSPVSRRENIKPSVAAPTSHTTTTTTFSKDELMKVLIIASSPQSHK